MPENETIRPLDCEQITSAKHKLNSALRLSGLSPAQMEWLDFCLGAALVLDDEALQQARAALQTVTRVNLAATLEELKAEIHALKDQPDLSDLQVAEPKLQLALVLRQLSKTTTTNTKNCSSDM